MSNPIRQASRWPIALAVLLVASSAQAEIRGEAIRIGVLTDMSGPFAAATGPGSVEAAKMAAEEFGGTINGKPITRSAGNGGTVSLERHGALVVAGVLLRP